ncbi:IPT/TIG domain-containing protein [Ascidiimonas aurantiaca]|uniref:IPT/TIG domain-containing protein n=1 Tax=Ascidiimonas aurantiaca TaxID=1685432 RepID=UPI0030EEEAFF
MKKVNSFLNSNIIWLVFVQTFLLSFLYSCNDDDIHLEPLGDLSITEITPLSARVGEEVIIRGTGFDTTYLSRNEVLFTITSGSISNALVKKATPTELTVVVPESSTINGPVTVTVRDQEAISSQNFIVDTSLPAPVITMINPTSGIVNDEIIITGDNFIDGEDQPTVFFEDVEAEIVNATFQEIIVKVPTDVLPGEVLVTVTRSGSTSVGVPFTVNEPPATVRETYWTNASGINRGIIQETGVQIETLYNTPQPSGIAIDTQRNFLYWGDNRFSDGYDIYKASIDGSGTPEIIFSVNDDFNTFKTFRARDIALDVQANIVYIAVTEEGFDFNTGLPTINTLIYRGDLNTENLDVLTTITGAFPGGLKIDPITQKFYVSTTTLDFFTGVTTGTIFKGALDGSSPVEVLYDSSDGLEDAANIAINPDMGTLYVINRSFISGPAIFQGNLNGSGSLTNFVEGGTDLGDTSDLEIDIENSFLFWINQETDGAIKRAALDGSGIEDLFRGINFGLYFDLNIQ